MTVTIHFIVTLEFDGAKVDSTYDRNKPIVFVQGTGQVIKGLDEGVLGMRVGSKRRITIPPELAYGRRGSRNIPPLSTLVIEVELINAK